MSDPGPDDRPNAAQIAYWNDRAGATWTELQERLDRSFASITALILERAAARPGESVLDVGCGCGETTLALARAVAPDGRVLGVDVSHPMAGRARERIAAAGLANATVAVDDAASYAFPPEGTDLLFSRFGVMFFEDPAAAFTNLRRAMKPAGRLAFVCWRPMPLNIWMNLPFEAAKSLLPPLPPPVPGAPGPFAFADPDRVRAILAGAGWHDAVLDPADTAVRLGALATAVEGAMRMGPLASALAEQPEDMRRRARDAVAEALAARDGPDGIVLPAAVWLVTARA